MNTTKLLTTLLLTVLIMAAACAPSEPAPAPTDTPDPAVTGTDVQTGDQGTTETSTEPETAPPGEVTLDDVANEAAEDKSGLEAPEGETSDEEKPDGFDNWTFPADWPKDEVPALHEFWFTVYEWDGNHMHAEGDGEIEISRVFNYHENFTNVGWEWDRQDEWIREGVEWKIFLKREGMRLEAVMHDLGDGKTHLVLDFFRE